MRKPVQITLLAAACAVFLLVVTGAFSVQGDRIVRGYFRLARQGQNVHVTSDSDALVFLTARNNGPGPGGLQIVTPFSEFHGFGSDPKDEMVLDLPGNSGGDLGCIGLKAGEVLEITQAYNSRVTVFVTVQSAGFATVDMY